MTRLLPLLFLMGLAAELASIIVVGNLLGVISTLLLILAGVILGVGLFRSAGTNVLAALRSPIQGSSLQEDAAREAIARAVSGFFFLVPGFFSDVIGFLLLLPPVRRWLRSRLPVHSFSSAGRAGPQEVTIIEAEATEIVGEIHPPVPPSEQRSGPVP